MPTNEKIVEDGPLFPDDYFKTECIIRVLHLLKEPTEYNKSLGAALEDSGVKGCFWKMTARRSYCIQNNIFPDRETIKNLDNEDLLKALKKSAIVNLSNICRNAKTTNSDEVFEFAEENFERWFGQLKECKPNIIICGGTFDAVFNTLEKKGYVKDEDKRNTSDGEQYFIFKKESLNAIFLESCHPSYRREYWKKYKSFCANTKEIYHLIPCT